MFLTKIIRQITPRRKVIFVLTVTFFLTLMAVSFIRTVRDPSVHRSDLPISTVEDALSSRSQASTNKAVVHLSHGDVNYEYGGNGRNVVFLHCWAGSKEYWKWTTQALTPHFRVYALDLKGFGDSDKPDDGYTIDDFSNSVAEFFNAVKIDKAIIVGHSMGGKIAVDFTERYPDRVEKLVLVGTPIGKVSMGLRIFTFPIIGRPWYWIVRKLVGHSLQTQEAKDAWQKPTTNSAIKSMKMLSKTNIADKLMNIHVPTLVVTGERDRSANAKQNRVYLQNLKDVKLCIIRNAGHSPMCENPSAFSHLLLGFAMS